MSSDETRDSLFHDYSRIEALVNAHNNQATQQKKEKLALASKGRTSKNRDRPLIVPVAGPLALTQPSISLTNKKDDTSALLPYRNDSDTQKAPKQASVLARARAKGAYYLTKVKRAVKLQKVYKAGGKRKQKKEYSARNIFLNSHISHPVPRNLLKNNKYNVVTFVPKILYQQFKYFFNLYFLGITISQCIPILRVGLLFTYIAPLVFVLAITMIKEFVDDIQRVVRDRAVNREKYIRLRTDAKDINDVEDVLSQDITVGDILVLHPGQRVPTDCIILQLQNDGHAVDECFIKTDQLDGETDWKMRKALAFTQNKPVKYLRDVSTRAIFEVEAAHKDIYSFKGRANYIESEDSIITESISLENTVWSSTVIASPSTTIALVAYVGAESKARLNTNAPQIKVGIFDKEIDMRAMSLFWLQFVAAAIYSWLGGNSPITADFYIIFFRYLLLFSSIVPISLRVNMDLAKIITSLMIRRDRTMQNCVVRTTTIPEQLGRIGYIMSDKTGTLTQNIMSFRSLHTGKNVYETLSQKDYDQSRLMLKRAYKAQAAIAGDQSVTTGVVSGQTLQDKQNTSTEQSSFNNRLVMRRQIHGDVYSFIPTTTFSSVDGISEDQKALLTAVRILALCNTVVPIERSVINNDLSFLNEEGTIAMWSSRHLQALATSDMAPSGTEIMQALRENNLLQISGTTSCPPGIGGGINPDITYFTLQASSPDEMSLVKLAAELNLTLMHRDRTSIQLQNPLGQQEAYTILYTFPFTSVTKRMAIILENQTTGELLIMMKGADSVMLEASNPAPWAAEQVSTLAHKGLRTLVFAQRTMTREELASFTSLYKAANEALDDRQKQIITAENSILHSMDVVAVTGVEDKLQEDVKLTIQQLRDAGIRIFLLTGDKSDTSMCIARSTNLISPNQTFHEITMGGYESAITGGGQFGVNKKALEVHAEDSHRLGESEEDSVAISNNRASQEASHIDACNSRLREYIATELAKIEDANYECVPIIDGKILAEILLTLPETSLKEFRGETISKEELQREKEISSAINAQSSAFAQGMTNSHGGRSGRCSRKDNNAKFGSSLAKQFIITVAKCPSFICSRCSPEQKAIITKMVSSLHTDYMCCNPRCKCKAPKVGVLAVGDGGNDVSMIQSAAVGVGLAGKEGKQASLASDFALERFMDLSSLLLYHGRLNYMRGYSMAHFIFSRGLTISVMQAIFALLYEFSTIPLFTGWLMLGYTVVFTSLPVTAICFDRDLPRNYMVQRFPILYKDSQRNKRGLLSCFFRWICMSIFQGTVILIFSQFLASGGLYGSAVDDANFYNLVGVGYSALLMTEMMTLNMEVYQISWLVFVTNIVSYGTYLAAMYILPDYFDEKAIYTIRFWFYVVLVACAAFIPPFIFKWFRKWVAPTEAEKLRRQWLADRSRARYLACCKNGGSILQADMKGDNNDPL